MSSTSTSAELKTTSRPYLALGLTFLLLGIGYSLPLKLVPVPPKHIWEGSLAPEILNLYALTVFAGWSHFAYAWRGQWLASRRYSRTSRTGYWAAVCILLLLLVALRTWLGVAVFSLLAWVYNISHFVKAEVFFSGISEIRTAYYSPVVAFAWFTLCLFRAGSLGNPLIVFAGSAAIAVVILACGGWQMLAKGEVLLPLLTLFLLGETMVWSSYGRYMSESFRVGIYIFHIAAASFYHYLTAYFYAESRGKGTGSTLRSSAILMVNFAMIVIGIATAWLHGMQWLQPLFGVGWFTLWVALHLAGSDLQPIWKRHLVTAPSP
ncbi:MAG TPA: hypothetical protein VFS41_07720 [Edaphobacter sp.]|nr:hypothetical protein [Edaphobacter sp.]